MGDKNLVNQWRMMAATCTFHMSLKQQRLHLGLHTAVFRKSRCQVCFLKKQKNKLARISSSVHFPRSVFGEDVKRHSVLLKWQFTWEEGLTEFRFTQPIIQFAVRSEARKNVLRSTWAGVITFEFQENSNCTTLFGLLSWARHCDRYMDTHSHYCFNQSKRTNPDTMRFETSHLFYKSTSKQSCCVFVTVPLV